LIAIFYDAFDNRAGRLKQRTLTRGALAAFFPKPNTPRGLVDMEI